MLILSAFLLAAVAAEPNAPPGFEVHHDPIESPKGSYVAAFYVPASDLDRARQLWVRSKTNPSDATLIYEYVRDADVLFSPDEKWLIVNDYAGSNLSEIVLFRQERGTKFTQSQIDVTGIVWRSFSTRYRLRHGLDLDHQYIEGVRWAENSKAFLVVLWGHTDINRYVDPWYCAFDLTTQRPSLDLAVMNRGSVHMKRRRR